LAKKPRPEMFYYDERRVGLAPAPVEESTCFGKAALKIKEKLFVRLGEEGGVVALDMPFELRDGLLADDPDTYFILEHNREKFHALVRLANLTEPVRHELLLISDRADLPPKRQKPGNSSGLVVARGQRF
jgi:hypothetical protein